jgi:hypothetical protein
VFPMRYELDLYILFRRNLVFKALSGISHCVFCFVLYFSYDLIFMFRLSGVLCSCSRGLPLRGECGACKCT